jgi:hypothetical protein
VKPDGSKMTWDALTVRSDADPQTWHTVESAIDVSKGRARAEIPTHRTVRRAYRVHPSLWCEMKWYFYGR